MKLKVFFYWLVVILMVFSCAKQQEQQTKDSVKFLKATATMVIGDAYVLKAKDPKQHLLKNGDLLFPEDVIITKESGKVNITVENSGILRILPNSQVVLSSLLLKDNGAAEQKIAVRTGKIILGLKKLQRDSSFNVETPTAVAGVRGTSFAVDVKSDIQNAFPFFVKIDNKNVKTRVAVFSGTVEMYSEQKEKSVMVEPMKMAILDGDDFNNIKVVPIDRVYLSDFDELRKNVDLNSPDMKEISEEIQWVDVNVSAKIQTKLQVKTKVNKASSSQIEVKDNVESTEKVDKVKTEQKREGKYLDSGENF